MQRRQFLQTLGSAGLATAVAGCARTLQLPRAGMAGPPDGQAPDVRDPDGVWREAAAYARWTASPHNIQPWRLRLISGRVAELYVDPRRRLPTTDPTSAFTIMSLAMFVEALSLAVAPRGLQLNAHYDTRALDYASNRPQLFATLQLSELTDITHGDAARTRERLLDRQTSRLPYDGTPAPTESMTALAALAEQSEHRLQWSSDETFVQDCLRLNKRALFDDLGDAPARTELRGWIRTTDTEAETHRDGLWSHCLRFPGWLLRDFFDHHERWARGKRADLCGRLLMRGMRGTKTIAWWSGPFATPTDWIRCGQVLSHTWQDLTKRGLAMHPFGSVVTNARTHGDFVQRLGADAPTDSVWLIARIGKSARPPRSYRVETPSLFLSEQELL